MIHDQATDKETDYSDQGWPLQVAEAGYGVAGGTSSCVTGSKTYQEPTTYEDQQSFKGQG